MNKLLIILLTTSLVGCSNHGDVKVFAETRWKCSEELQSVVAVQTLQCIANANPKSDEEPEDWIMKCRNMFVELYCERKSVLVEKTYNGHYWQESKVTYLEASDE